jgi:hypothetical protein
MPFTALSCNILHKKIVFTSFSSVNVQFVFVTYNCEEHFKFHSTGGPSDKLLLALASTLSMVLNTIGNYDQVPCSSLDMYMMVSGGPSSMR